MHEQAPGTLENESLTAPASPEIKLPEYTPDKVRLFLIADEETRGRLEAVYDTLRAETDGPKLRRIYEDISGIPIVTLNREDQLRTIAQSSQGSGSLEPDFLSQLTDSLIDEPLEAEEVVLGSPIAKWSRADRVSMLVAGFDASAHQQAFAKVKNRMLRNLQQRLMGINERSTESVLHAGSVAWMHEPAPYLPLARPCSWLKSSERAEIAHKVAEKLPQQMCFRPFVATPEPLDYEQLPKDLTPTNENKIHARRIASRYPLGATALTIVERAVAVKTRFPEAEVNVYDRKRGEFVALEPDQMHNLRGEKNRYSTLHIRY